MSDHVRLVVSWLLEHAGAVVTALAAVAAMFSALSSLLIWRVQRSNLLESVRPELVLLDWSRVPPKVAGTHDSTRFAAIKNVGRGSAFNLWVRATYEDSGQETSAMSDRRFPILAVNEQITVRDAHVFVWFSAAPPRAAVATVFVTCWDSRGNHYETRYDLVIVHESGIRTLMADTIAPGVIATRTVMMTTARRMRMRARRNRLLVRWGGMPVLGKVITRVVSFATGWL